MGAWRRTDDPRPHADAQYQDLPVIARRPAGALGRALTLLGTSGSAFGGFAMLCCFGWTGLASFLPLIGLGFMVRFAYALRLIWVALAVIAIGLAISFLRHRRPWPLLLGLIGAVLTLYPMYHALEVSLWLGLLYAGLALLFVSAGADLWISIRHQRTCKPRIDSRPRPAGRGSAAALAGGSGP